MLKRLSKLGRDFQNAREGQAAAEFIFAIIFLMLLIAGIIESFGLIYTYSSLAASAKEGVRYAIVHGTGDTTCLTGTNPCTCSGPGNGAITCTDSAAANVASAVRTYAVASMHDTSAMTITTTYLDPPGGAPSSAAPNRVRVTISYPYQPFFGLGWPTITVNAAAEGRIFR